MAMIVNSIFSTMNNNSFDCTVGDARRTAGKSPGSDVIITVINMFRLTWRILQKSLRAKRSNLSGFPKDCFVAMLLAMTGYRSIFLTTAIYAFWVIDRERLPAAISKRFEPIRNTAAGRINGRSDAFLRRAFRRRLSSAMNTAANKLAYDLSFSGLNGPPEAPSGPFPA
jgi:hypothetical protein